MMLVWYRLNAQGTAYAPIGSIEDMASLVWTERWQDYGEAQVEMPLTHDVRTGDLLALPGRDMVVEVVGRTETEKGLELRCRDALSVLDRRIVYPTVANNGLVATFVEKLLTNDGIIRTNPWTRTLKPVRVGVLTAITGSANIQRSYGQVGETLLELAKAYGFDPVCSLQDGLLYIGARASSASRVWGLGLGLAGYTQDEDMAEARNVAYVGGQEHGGTREVAMVLDEDAAPASMDRREMFVDRRDIPFDDMDPTTAVETYGQQQGQAGNLSLDLETGVEGPVVILTQDVTHERATLQKYVNVNTYLGSEKLAKAVALQPWSAVTFMWIGDTISASIVAGGETVSFSLPDSVLDDCLYRVQPYSYKFQVLWAQGEEALADLQPQKVFEARLEGLTPYADYGLGDAVTIYGAGDARTGVVAEIVESWDQGGYRITPGLRMDTD